MTQPRPTAPTAPSSSALAALKFSQGTLSVEQQRFNKLLARTDVLARKIETVRTLADSHRPLFGNTVRPLELKRHALMREMALWLAARLQRKGLTARQKLMVRDILCGLAAALAVLGDAEMQDLHDAHSDMTMEEQEKSTVAEMQQMMEQMLGKPLGNEQQEFATIEEMMHASMAHLSQQAQDQEDARAAKKSRRKKTAGQQQAAQQSLEADGALRTIYRQLVSALHPDRESDAQERTRKTALMKEVNTAYERRDLLALLQLQLRAALADGDMVANLAQDKLRALTALLKERATVLTRELQEAQARTLDEFHMPADAPVTAASLHRHLLALQEHLQDEADMMAQDLLQVQNETAFKRWLREQHEPAHQGFDGFF